MTREQFYYARERRLTRLAEALPDLNLPWERIIGCHDMRRGDAACRVRRICPYCYIRYLLRDVWHPLRAVPAEIFTREVADNLEFDILRDGLKHVASGCVWVRRWTLGPDSQPVDSVTFITPTGSRLLELQEDAFIEALSVQSEFLSAPLPVYAGIVRQSLERHTTGKLGIMRQGVRAVIGGVRRRLAPRQILQPSLRELSLELYTAFRAASDVDVPEVQPEQESDSMIQTATSAATHESNMTCYRLMFFALRQAGLVNVTLEQFMAALPPIADAIFKSREEFERVIGWPQEDPRWRQVIDIFRQQETAFGGSIGAFFDYFGEMQRQQAAAAESARMQQQMDQTLGQPAIQAPTPAAPLAPTPQPAAVEQYPGVHQAQPQYPGVHQATPQYPGVPQAPTAPATLVQPQQFYTSPSQAQEVKQAIETQQGPLVHGMPPAMVGQVPQQTVFGQQPQGLPGLPQPQAGVLGGGLQPQFMTQPQQPVPTQPPVPQVPTQPPTQPAPPAGPPAGQQQLPFVASEPNPEVPPFDVTKLPAPVAGQLSRGQHVEFELGASIIRGFITRQDGTQCDMISENGQPYLQVSQHMLRLADGPVVLQALVTFDALQRGEAFAAMQQSVDAEPLQVLQDLAMAKTAGQDGTPLVFLVDVANPSEKVHANAPGPMFLARLETMDGRPVASLTTKTYQEQWVLQFGHYTYVLETPRPDETTKASPKKGERKKRQTKKEKEAAAAAAAAQPQPAPAVAPTGAPTA